MILTPAQRIALREVQEQFTSSDPAFAELDSVIQNMLRESPEVKSDAPIGKQIGIDYASGPDKSVVQVTMTMSVEYFKQLHSDLTDDKSPYGSPIYSLWSALDEVRWVL